MAKLFDFTIKNGAAGGFGMFSAAHFAWLAVLLAAGDGTSARGAAVRGWGI